MHYLKYFSIVVCLLAFYSCGNLIKDSTGSSTPDPSLAAPTIIPLPINDSYTYIPATNDYIFKNTAGGSFRITQVYSYLQKSSTFEAATSDGEFIYTLVNNSKAFSGSYLINKFKLDGSSYLTFPPRT